MTRRKSNKSEQPDAIVSPDVEQAEATVLEAPEVELEPTETPDPVASEVKPEPTEASAPVELELQTPKESGIKDKATKESIEAAIKEKLSRKTDSNDIDPFVPSTQLDNEVKDIANKGGFPLSRGTEVGARLMARAKRTLK
jgi:hypothetical protein